MAVFKIYHHSPTQSEPLRFIRLNDVTADSVQHSTVGEANYLDFYAGEEYLMSIRAEKTAAISEGAGEKSFGFLHLGSNSFLSERTSGDSQDWRSNGHWIAIANDAIVASVPTAFYAVFPASMVK